MIIKAFEGRLSPQGLKLTEEVLRNGGVIIYPTDTVYSIGCDALNVKALQRLAELKGVLPSKSSFSILCSDIAQASMYAKIDDDAFRFLKAHTPGPFTFVLPVNNALPRIYKERKEVGIRIPGHPLPISLIEYFGSPLSGFSLPRRKEVQDEAYEYHPELIHELWDKHVDLVVDGGIGGAVPSTIIDCKEEPYRIIRQGAGSVLF